jgi:hypothetical protein
MGYGLSPRGFPFIATRVIWLRHMCRQGISRDTQEHQKKEKKKRLGEDILFPFLLLVDSKYAVKNKGH